MVPSKKFGINRFEHDFIKHLRKMIDFLLLFTDSFSESLHKCVYLFRITKVHLHMVLEWAEETHNNVAFNVDELLLIDKIKAALGEGPAAQA